MVCTQEELARCEQQVLRIKANIKDHILRRNEAQTGVQQAQAAMQNINGRLSYSPNLPDDLSIKILNEVGSESARSRMALSCRRLTLVVALGNASGLFGQKISAIAASRNHSVLCSEDGDVLTFGCGKQGRLGHGGEKAELLPRVVQGLSQKKIVAVAAGEAFTVVCTAEGEVLSWGQGADGQLGHGDSQNEMEPRTVNKLLGRHITSVAAGSMDLQPFDRTCKIGPCPSFAALNYVHVQDVTTQ